MSSAVPNSFPFARMSPTHKSFRFLFLSLFLSVLFVFPESALSSSSSSNSIQNLLQSQGLPGGLFPHDVKSFTLHADGLLEVLLDRPCLAKFDTRVYFDSVVRANLTYGKLMGMEGLSQKELFLWLPVKDIMVDDPSSGVIVFDIGVAYKQLSLSLFEDPPVCRPPDLEVLQPNIGRKKIGFEALR